ncbi:meiosis-specific protein ASY2-like [Arabidopsis lyrata subsp. lyrata]|uniref:meiosis-specific protein ASY2-like n=1 Tax=Arabidopsis lyrata subsp. lyrata TaxID=81972 RepID=UPI000A29C131|nr:meiosis-specific protein ASY2-like [Arabidopsis lyrata subsp. lyrata]|eukprot:XP_020866112.1 meiosis-specific protein ASY2-like [Arabidopsis lyrata subsp. lyrata]
MSSSVGSFDSISDHRRSRTSDESNIRSVDRFLNESVSNSRGRRSRTSSRSSASSVARDSPVVAELRRRELESRVGAAGPSANPKSVTTMCLRDDDSDAASTDEDNVPLIRRKSSIIRAARSVGPSSDVTDRLDIIPLTRRAPAPVGFVQPGGPAPGIPDYLQPTSSTSETIELSLHFCDAPASLNTLIPNPWDRPWTAPPGYLCVYEKLITDCGLTFPIPAFLLQYASRREMAFAQLSPAAIRNAYGLIRLAEQCGVEPRCSLYEELTTKKNFGKSKPGLVYTQSSLTPKLVVGAKSKTNDWLRWYFFVKIDNDSAGDVVVTNYHGWTISPVRCPKILDPYPEKLRDDVKKILALCPYTWPNEEDPVRRPSSKSKKTSRRGGPSKARKANKSPAPSKIMGKMNVDAVGDYSSRYKKKSSVTPSKRMSREEDEAMALGKRLSLAEHEAKESERRSSGRRDRRDEGDRRDRRGHDVVGADRSEARSDVERERREKEVAEARSAKLPVAETSHDVPLGGREVILYDNSQVEPTKKRAADESEPVRSDPTKKQRMAWAPDYRWRYDYNGRDVHISTDSTSCAELFLKLHVGPSPFFELQDMWERTAFTDAAKKTVAAIGAIDRMAYMYERRLRVVSEQNTASKDHQRALAAETRRADQASKGLESANSEVQLLREEVAKLKEERDNALSERERCLVELSKSRVDFKNLAEQSQAEEARLRKRRTEYARKALKEAADQFQQRLDGIQRHFTTRDAAYPKFLDYNQAVGSVDLLKALAETGEVVLNSKDVIERLEADAEELKNEVNAFDIAELEEGWNDVGNLFTGSLAAEEFAPSVEGVDDEVAGDVEAVDQVVGDGDAQIGDPPQDEAAS